jgi:hypothetical protein
VTLLFLRRWVTGTACLAAVASGCDPFSSDALVIATSWPPSERRQIETEFARWLEEHSQSGARGPIRLEWLTLEPGDDRERLAARRDPPDVLLGGPVRSFERLARARRLAPLPLEGSPPWAVSRDGVIRPAFPAIVTFDDPRTDPIALAWVDAHLAGREFLDGYAATVNAAAISMRVERAPGPVFEHGDWQDSLGIVWVEGVAILGNGRHRDHAESLVQFLHESGRARPARPHPDSAPSADEPELLADLLGATLVDARDELGSAWSALERAGSPPGPLRWMTEPPPWPPASIGKILNRNDEQAMAMVETLAGQLATDATVRSWLIRSWLSPPRRIDRRILEELARAADGRLIREPRFRAWLRAEWTAWARQRYRRVLRTLEGDWGSTARSPAPPVQP